MPETIFELKDTLTRATDPEGNVLDAVAVNHVIVSLEGMTITPEDLQATRIGKQVNEIRKNTKDNKLAKRIRKLVKKWQNLLPTGLNLKHPNGTTLPVENGMERKPSLATVTASILPNTNNSSSSFTSTVNNKSLKIKEQLSSNLLYQPTTSTTVTNSAPHPINASTRLQAHRANSTVVKFIHPPPEPMPSSLIVSIGRHSVKLKSDNTSISSLSVSSDYTDGFSLISPPDEFGSTPDMFGSVDPCIMDMLSSYDSSKTFDDDDLLDIGKSQTSTGRITPADETIIANIHLLDMDYKNLTGKDDQFSADSIDSKDRIEGVGGYFSSKGAWCDWTQPIPPKSDDSVVVLPYVYID